ncbi:AAA family ATPase [Halogeometricum borinquense]|uniref:ORC1-type DNA replication protein n=1 Tax=Halogeometricum borinquense TaxID=60847 RepID=A0A6C0UKH6_9EURY|nr:orc1/cdc6 family replication initiation protein [Halogeometricum borinquense]QIB76012.1 AAA family ATPase [Halogeometricum borinquense]
MNGENSESTTDERDPLFRYDQPIFANKEILEISHLPGPDKIVGRDEHMSQVAEALNPAIFGQSPTHLFIFGKTGSGKTLTARMVSRRLQQEAQNEGVTVRVATVDCGEQNTEASVIKTLASSVNDPSKSGMTIPERGLSTGDYYNRLWRVLDTCSDVTIVVLDEIDMLQDDEVLRKLSRAGENQRIVDSRLGIIGVSNKIDFPDELTERVKSSFAHDELVFSSYDANELREILRNRTHAFEEGALTDDVIPLTSALAAQEHGDARKAIDILRNAGRIATKEDAEKVTEDHVRAAKEKTETDRFRELLDGQTSQSKVILYALVLQTEGDQGAKVTTSNVYRQYLSIANSLDMDQLSERRVQEILKELDFLNVIQSEVKGRGRGQGIHGRHRLLEEPRIVKRVLLSDPRFENLRDQTN